jgi:hypothetical protein
MNSAALLPLTVLSLLSAACIIKTPGDLGELGDDEGTSSPASVSGGDSPTEVMDPDTGDTSDSTHGSSEDTEQVLTPATGVDVLFIIDNSGSMAEEQQRIAEGIAAFVDPLTAAGLDLRIAITTTDHGNPRCSATDPENGAFVVESCRARVAGGEYMIADGDFSAACTDVCAHEQVVTLPTTTADDPTPSPRPWIEWSAGATNVEVPLAEALTCAIPQGIVGCGFEQPLEALHTALLRAQDGADPAAGFLRPDAHFVAIVVTDEMDCSYSETAEEIFISNKTFWWSPDDPAPTSSVCWDAGVTCEGGPGVFDDCVASDHDLAGAVTDNSALAALRPVSRYDDALAALAADKQAAGSAAGVQLVIIGGVPIGWPQNPLVFEDVADPDYMSKFGIGPGCTADDVTAVPPARLREVAAQHAPFVQPMFSICQPNFAGPLSVIASAIAAN